jgi:hypothetical protein
LPIADLQKRKPSNVFFDMEVTSSERFQIGNRHWVLSIRATTDFSRVVFQLRPRKSMRANGQTPPTLVAWWFNFNLGKA